jgi:hypothetical protein
MDESGGQADERALAVLPTTAEAVSASVACARALGLPADDPEVIAEGYSVRVRLHPAPVVTRVVTAGRELRPNPLPWLEREVSVAQHLAASGVPVVAPWDDPGPHLAEGLEVSLWHWADHDDSQVSAAEFGSMHWTDFEDVCVGPVEWDLASMTLTDETLHAYSGHIDPTRRADCRDLRPLQILASLVVGDYDEPALHHTLVTHLSQRRPV